MSGKRPPQANLAAMQAGIEIFRNHPIFSFINFASTANGEDFPQGGFARIVVKKGNERDKIPYVSIALNPWQRAKPEEWAYVLGQCNLHIALNHIDPVRSDEAWRLACELIVVDDKHICIIKIPSI